MSDTIVDRNLLFGMLAVQVDFISRDLLVSALQDWALDKSKSFGQFLAEQHSITPDQQSLLDSLVIAHLEQHDNDSSKSLGTVTWTPDLRRGLNQIRDSDLVASIHHLAETASNGSEEITVVSTGTPSSNGQRFRVLRPHAKGGLGEVFVASDEELHRKVALKQIQHRHADNPETRVRFLLEAEITGGLEHPSIVPVYGLGTYPDGRPFYAMRFIEGDSLKEAIQRFHEVDWCSREPGEQILEQRKLLGRFIDVCDAIEYAHSRGVLHRDLKPGNIMLGKYGETLVVDWGLAKSQDATTATPETRDKYLYPTVSGGGSATQVGSTLGTPQFMSPEQAAGRIDLLGPASDIYSLGATLYCLLTGAPAITEKYVAEILLKVRSGDFAKPRQIKPEIPAALEAVCLKAMALEPADRYGSSRLLADDLEHWLADEPVSAYPEPWNLRLARWGRHHRTLVQAIGAALLAVALIAVVAAVLINRARQETQVQRGLAEESFRQARQAVDGYYTTTSETRLLNEPGLQDLRKELLVAAQHYYEGFLVQRANDPSLREELAAANFRLGRITNEIGSKDAALEYFQTSRRMQEDLVHAKPEDLNQQYALSNSWNELGRVNLEMARFPDAESAFRHSLDLRKKLTKRDLKNPEYQRKLASSFMNMGSLNGSRDKLEEAFSWLKQAIDLQRRLTVEHPLEAIYRRDLGKAFYNLALLQRRGGRAAEALASCRQALVIYQQLFDEQPKVIEFQGLIALTARVVDDLSSEAGKQQESLDAFEKSRQLVEQLIKHNPLVSDYQAELAVIVKRIAQLTADPEQSLAQYLAAKDILKQLAADNPRAFRYQADLASNWLDIGLLEKQRHQPDKALLAFEQSLEAARRWLALDAQSMAAGDSAAKAQSNSAMLIRAMPGRLPEALKTYEEVLKTYQLMATQHPSSPEPEEGLARSYLNIGLVSDNLARPAEARTAYEEAMKHQRRAVELAPQATEYRQRLLAQAGEVAALHRQFGRASDALAVGLAHKTLAAAHPEELLDAARSLALTAAAAGPDTPDLPAEKRALRQQAVDGAVGALREAKQAGLKSLERLRTDRDLQAIEKQPAFIELLEAQ
jgi:tetratricopeptide (TPR) repeat protein/tRNA A-37 threonylcarbamoyl transferase component Bud32